MRVPDARRDLVAVLLALTLITVGGCGGDESPAASPRRDPAVSPRPLPPVPRLERARFALERLERGPLPRTAAFAIPTLHALNLEFAQLDLLALPNETIALLSDTDRIERITRPREGGYNPWHGVLDVLTRLDGVPVELALAWTRPAVGRRDPQLQRRAIRALGSHQDVRIAPVLLALLEQRVSDRQAAPYAIRRLLGFGSPWAERAAEIVYRQGDLSSWQSLSGLYAPALAGGPTPVPSALAWWALLAEASGPASVSGAGRPPRPAWFLVRLRHDPAVWPGDAADLQAAAAENRVVAPSLVFDTGSWTANPPETASFGIVPWWEMLASGRLAAARARCALAEAGSDAHLAAVAHDLTASDPDLRHAAAGCAVSAIETLDAESARAHVEQFGDRLAAGLRPPDAGVVVALRRLASEDADAALALALNLLSRARPYDTYRAVLEGIYDVGAELDGPALADEVIRLLGSDDPGDVQVALALARRARDARYAPAIETLLARAAPPQAKSYRSLLVWLYGTAEDGRALRSFVETFAGWIAEASDGEAQGLVTGLLDLGEAGAEAYAAGLEGTQRHVYLHGLTRRSGLVPLRVAAALLAPVDASTSPPERRAALIAAYRTAPPDAAAHLAALRARLLPETRAEVDDVLETVRHRADR